MGIGLFGLLCSLFGCAVLLIVITVFVSAMLLFLLLLMMVLKCFDSYGFRASDFVFVPWC